ncbi:protein tyrosine kinase domain-containing protein [Ditylenchus destructor]|uniref:Tyrosine-protein kinase n=1 Tax=Ditylenchus destructor TaxID=166010 RepID=A0AAD4MPN5_9BILA|nr:protein tyrosine kinase domain-containing protein [Ditylenchus destructor]
MSKEKHVPRKLVSRAIEQSREVDRQNAGYKPPTHEDNYAWSPMPVAPENDLPVLDRPPVLPGHEGIDDTLSYYHGLLPRRDVEEILAEEGDFLLRNSETVRGSGVHSICVSVLWKKCALHYPITVTEAGEFTLDGTLKFAKILDLINYYYKKKRPFKENAIRLLTPTWEFLHKQVELKKKIGEGAFGAIYSGYLMTKYLTVPLPVAVKASKEKIEELMSEARMMRHLDHPNIVKMYGVATAVEPLFIVMELLENGSLDEYLKRSGAHASTEERLCMIRDVMYAIQFIHTRGIIHCDIAARNCLCGEGEVKLSDFGMAKNTDRHNLTPSDRTPVRWAAPEVFTERVTTKATDIWAMGVLIWEVFNNAKLPYEEMEGQQIRDQASYVHTSPFEHQFF